MFDVLPKINRFRHRPVVFAEERGAHEVRAPEAEVNELRAEGEFDASDWASRGVKIVDSAVTKFGLISKVRSKRKGFPVLKCFDEGNIRKHIIVTHTKTMYLGWSM